jgi:hypothetical protein
LSEPPFAVMSSALVQYKGEFASEMVGIGFKETLPDFYFGYSTSMHDPGKESNVRMNVASII